MPYASERQRRWAHTRRGKKALGGAARVSEWDKASEHMRLPERANEPPERTTRTAEMRRRANMTPRKGGRKG